MHVFSFIIKPNFIGKKKGCYNDDGTISKFCVNQDHYILNLIFKKHTNDKKLIMYPKELKTNSSVLYVVVSIKN